MKVDVHRLFPQISINCVYSFLIKQQKCKRVTDQTVSRLVMKPSLCVEAKIKWKRLHRTYSACVTHSLKKIPRRHFKYSATSCDLRENLFWGWEGRAVFPPHVKHFQGIDRRTDGLCCSSGWTTVHRGGKQHTVFFPKVPLRSKMCFSSCSFRWTFKLRCVEWCTCGVWHYKAVFMITVAKANSII